MKFGQQEMIISDVTFREAQTGTPGVVINGTVGDESIAATVWISEKSAVMAHKALKNCGFDSDVQDLSELQENPALLRGNQVLVNVSETEQYGIKAEIVLNTAPEAEKMKMANSILKGRAKAPKPPAGQMFPEPKRDEIPF